MKLEKIPCVLSDISHRTYWPLSQGPHRIDNCPRCHLPMFYRLFRHSWPCPTYWTGPKIFDVFKVFSHVLLPTHFRFRLVSKLSRLRARGQLFWLRFWHWICAIVWVIVPCVWRSNVYFSFWWDAFIMVWKL